MMLLLYSTHNTTKSILYNTTIFSGPAPPGPSGARGGAQAASATGAASLYSMISYDITLYYNIT